MLHLTRAHRFLSGLAVSFGALAAVSCAAGTTGDRQSTTSSSNASSSSGWMGITTSSASGSASSASSSSSGLGGLGVGGSSMMSGSSSSGGGSGTGGAATSSSSAASSSSSASSTSSSTSSSSSSGSTGAVLLLGSSSSTILGGSLHPGGTWTTATVGTGSALPPTLTTNAAGNGVGVVVGSGNVLSYTVWSAGSWSSPATIAASAITQSPAWIDANNGPTAQLVYQDPSFKYWYLSYSGSSWTAPQALGVPAGQFYGAFAATIAAVGTTAAVSFFDGQSGNKIAASDLISGDWQPATELAGNTLVGNTSGLVVPPCIVALAGGPDVLVIYADANTNIQSFRRTSGSWATSATPVTGALTANYMGLAPLANGAALLAFRGTDGFLYWSLYSGGSWSTVAPFATPNVKIDGTPSVSHGVGGNLGEIAYLAGGVAYHASLSMTDVWSAPVVVGGSSLTSVVIAATP